MEVYIRKCNNVDIEIKKNKISEPIYIPDDTSFWEEIDNEIDIDIIQEDFQEYNISDKIYFKIF
jgi:hypothetical protein